MAYKSRRGTWQCPADGFYRRVRLGRVIGTDKSGRVILDLGGHTVRRQPHLILAA